MVAKDVPQSTIILGDLGLTKDNPDQYPGRVLNFFFGGGGFNSRLMQEIRGSSKRVKGVRRLRVHYGTQRARPQV